MYDESPTFQEVLRKASSGHPDLNILLETFHNTGGAKHLKSAILAYKGKKEVLMSLIFSYIVWLEINNITYSTGGADEWFKKLTAYLDSLAPRAPSGASGASGGGGGGASQQETK
jgi:hypothetical protein